MITNKDLLTIFFASFPQDDIFYDMIINLLLVKNNLRKATLLESAGIKLVYPQRSEFLYQNVIKFIQKYIIPDVLCIEESTQFGRYLVVNNIYKDEFLVFQDKMNTQEHNHLLGKLLEFFDPGNMDGIHTLKIFAMVNDKFINVSTQICRSLPTKEICNSIVKRYNKLAIPNLKFLYKTSYVVTVQNIKYLVQNMTPEIYKECRYDFISLLEEEGYDVKSLRAIRNFEVFKKEIALYFDIATN